MTSAQILEVVNRYDQLLRDAGYMPIEHSHEQHPISVRAQLNHVRSMVPRMRQMLNDGHSDKVNRWLGWVQGVLWSCGIKTLAEERDDNR